MTILQILIKHFPKVKATGELKTILGQYVIRQIRHRFPYEEIKKVKEGNYNANDYPEAMIPDIIDLITGVTPHLK